MSTSKTADGGNFSGKKNHNKEKSNFEKSMKRLEEIVKTLEGGTLSLDQSLAIYEEGVNISKECIEQLSKAEVRLKSLLKDIDGNLLLKDEEMVDEEE